MAFARRFGDVAAIIAVTLLFVLMHPGRRLIVFPVAIVLAVVRLRTKSVAACFALHGSYNLFLVLYAIAFQS